VAEEAARPTATAKGQVKSRKDGQPPFVAGEDRIIDIDFGRLPSEAMGELWPG
jgi:hypothetical protein